MIAEVATSTLALALWPVNPCLKSEYELPTRCEEALLGALVNCSEQHKACEAGKPMEPVVVEADTGPLPWILIGVGVIAVFAGGVATGYLLGNGQAIAP
jgi:hypothetical protein